MCLKNNRVLLTQEKYQGKYVAFGVDDKRIVAFGSDPGIVISRARAQGVEDPAIVFVPKTNVAYVY